MINHFLERHGFLGKHFLLYTVIGLSGVVLDFALYLFLTKVLDVQPLAANFISISIAIANNFWLNKVYNFKVNDHLTKRFMLFYSVGLFGIIVSEALLFGLHYLLGIDDLLSKLLTLPIVLALQFVLNKSYSFGDIKQTRYKLGVHLFHWPLIIILIFYAIFSLITIRSIPTTFYTSTPGMAPDEAIHYRFNVEFIMKNKQLPVAGVDDLEAYHACRDNPIGQVPCVYSYNIFPGPNYVAGAVVASIFKKAGTISPEVASRFVSLAAGLMFVIFTYFTAYLICRRRLYTATLTAAVVFIPQVIYTNSYTNLDAHSLAISAILGFSLAGLAYQPRRKLWQIVSAVSLFGLLPLSKYNYFVLGLAGIALIAYIFIRAKFTKKEIFRYFLYALVSFLVLSSFWYIRNLLLYHDPLGQSYVLQKMSEFHSLGQEHPISQRSFRLLVSVDFFEILFKSVFVAFGLMFYFLEDYKYVALQTLLFATAAIFLYFTLTPDRKNKSVSRVLLPLIFYTLLVGTTLAIIIYNSLKFDFQPQGRYMFPVIIPTIMLVAYAIKHDKRFGIIAFLMLAGTSYIGLHAIDLFIRAYLPVL